jgi:hypothetical protein
MITILVDAGAPHTIIDGAEQPDPLLPTASKPRHKFF